MFDNQIGDTIGVYVDDMLVKSRSSINNTEYIAQIFQILKEYKMKLNPLKCAFGVLSGKFFELMVSHRGIEADLENPSVAQHEVAH